MSDAIIQFTTEVVQIEIVGRDVSEVFLNVGAELILSPVHVQGGGGGIGGRGSMDFVQAVPSALWIINHNLGFYPGVTLLTVGGLEFEGLVLNTSLNQVSVQLNQAQSGRAILQ